MNGNPDSLIEEYLERVRVYLPMNCEEILAEIRTHIIEAAEELGSGRVTPGSVILAIERLGDPKIVASEYAGTGERVGPIPVEYKLPLVRTITVVVAISIAFILGGAVVYDTALSMGVDILAVFQMFVISTVASFLVIILIIVLAFSTHKPMITKKTFVEHAFSFGVKGFKPKARHDAVLEMAGGSIFAMVFLLPQVQALFSPIFRQLIPIAIVLSVALAIKGGFFVIAGENTLNLITEGIVEVASVAFAITILNIGWPLDYWPVVSDGTWTLINIEEFLFSHGIEFSLFNGLWVMIIFVVIVTDTWRVIVASLKATAYIRNGKGLWWKREHHMRRYQRLKPHWWERKSKTASSKPPD